MNASTKKKIQKKCKIRGYNIKPEALEEILSFVTRFELTEEEDEATDIVLDHLEQESRNLSLSLLGFRFNFMTLIFFFNLF